MYFLFFLKCCSFPFEKFEKVVIHNQQVTIKKEDQLDSKHEILEINKNNCKKKCQL